MENLDGYILYRFDDNCDIIWSDDDDMVGKTDQYKWIGKISVSEREEDRLRGVIFKERVHRGRMIELMD